MRCSRIFWRPDMRSWLLMALLATVTHASAGALEKCRQKKQEADAIVACVETEQMRSTNQLRKVSSAARDAVHVQTQGNGKTAILREYRKMEARHVRERKVECRKQATPLERNACIADMNDAHIEQLGRFMK